MFLKRFQLGLVHVAVAMTLVPINSTLNRIMIKEFGISATLVAILVSLPYLFSPIQVMIGSFADAHPLWGRRRTPYIVLGLLLCIGGVALSPQAAFALQNNLLAGLGLSIVTFGAWGMGFNFAVVSYFSLASEISGPKDHSRTIAIMFFMMIIGIIVTAELLGNLLDPYTPDALASAFWVVGGLASIFGVIGLIGLEERAETEETITQARHSWGTLARTILGNRQATLFFWYLILLLAAILGQDILLEPYGAEAFGLPVNATTRLTRTWGVSFLISLVIASALERRMNKRTIAIIGAWGAILAFLVIVISGVVLHTGLFFLGVVLLGLATGLATVSNLSLMLDMTAVGRVGLFIGAWGMADAFARLTGNILSGVTRDTISSLSQNLVLGYQVAFLIEGVMLFVSLLILQQVSVGTFQKHADKEETSLVEQAVLAGEL